MKRFTTVIWFAAVVAFALLPLMIGLSMGQDGIVPVEGKKNRDKHKHVEPVDPVTPAPAPHIEPEPDPEFTEVMDIEKRPKPRPQPDSVEPVAPAKPVVIHKGSWSSWFGGLFVGIGLTFIGQALSHNLTVRKWIGI